MKTANAAAPKLSAVLVSRYGVDDVTADAITIEWAAAVVAAESTVTVAAAQWKRLNAKRARLGRVTTIPQWGTPMFAAYFA